MKALVEKPGARPGCCVSRLLAVRKFGNPRLFCSVIESCSIFFRFPEFAKFPLRQIEIWLSLQELFDNRGGFLWFVEHGVCSRKENSGIRILPTGEPASSLFINSHYFSIVAVHELGQSHKCQISDRYYRAETTGQQQMFDGKRGFARELEIKAHEEIGFVAVGSYKDLLVAETAQREASAVLPESFSISNAETPSGFYYRVLAGPYLTREIADHMQSEALRLGFEGAWLLAAEAGSLSNLYSGIDSFSSSETYERRDLDFDTTSYTTSSSESDPTSRLNTYEGQGQEKKHDGRY